MQLTITLTIHELLMLPGDAVTRILDKAKPSREFLLLVREWETRPHDGKGRWPVLNYITKQLL